MNSDNTILEPDLCEGTTEKDEEPSNRKCYFIQSNLSSAFSKLGYSVGRHPIAYCVVPLLVASILSVGFYHIKLTKEFEYLFSPINGRYLKERSAVESLFPPAEDGETIITTTRLRGTATILMEPKDSGSVLREDILEEASKLNEAVYNIKVSWNNTVFGFEDLCSKTVVGECQQNEVLSLRGKVAAMKRKKHIIKYPFEVDQNSKQVSFYAFGLGGVTTDENGNVQDAKAIRLIYMIDTTRPEKTEVNLKWENAFIEEVGMFKSDLVKISRETYSSLNDELNKLTEMTMPLLAITACFMVTFAVLSSMTKNWVTSKPWVAIAGCISPLLGGFSSIGLLVWCGLPYIDINIAVAFIILGIGLDDSFVILAAWRRTDPRESVEERMRQTYSEAAISITITSMTNVLSLFVGFGSPYRITRIYCAYASLSMFFAYIAQITFFGGVLALSGIREKKNLHSVLFIPVKKETIPDSALLKLLYVGITKPKEEKREQHILPTRKEKFLSFILTPFGRLAILCSFAIYLISSTYCLKLIQEGFSYKEAAPRNSYLVDYLETHYKHFTMYPHPIQLVINKTLDYSDRKVQKDIEDTIRYFANGPNMAGENICISWLKYYLESVKGDVYSFVYRGYNMSDPVDFVAGLRQVFLKFPYSKEFRPNIRFNHNKTQIVASRFIIVTKNINSSYQESQLVKTVWQKVDSSKYPMYAYNFWFPVYSTLLPVGASCFETMCTAIGIVTLVFFVFIPNIMCAISILFTIVSILIGVVGYMSWWGVTVDPVSMIALMMSVGLSIDYAAHISYAYLTCKEKTPNEKTIAALHIAGYPIIQGCLSTMLGVCVIAFGPSNMFLVFFKVITLVMLIALFHGLLVIPVMFNMFETLWIKFSYLISRRFCNGISIN